jgi:hypothetical protein
MEPSPVTRKADRSRLNTRHRAHKSRGASAVTNGTRLLLPISERSWIRRYRDLLEAVVADCGNWDGISNAELALARRISTLIVECERREKAFSLCGGADDVALAIFGTTVNTLRRSLETMCSGSLKRRAARDVTPGLDTILSELGPEDPKDPASPTDKGSTANGAGT